MRTLYEKTILLLLDVRAQCGRDGEDIPKAVPDFITNA